MSKLEIPNGSLGQCIEVLRLSTDCEVTKSNKKAGVEMLFVYSAIFRHFQASSLHLSRSVIFNIYKAMGVRTEVNCIYFEQNREIHFGTACSLSYGPLVFCLVPQWFFSIHSHNGVGLLIVIPLISIYLGLELTSKVPRSLRFFFLLISDKELSSEVSISALQDSNPENTILRRTPNVPPKG